jgi:hypothetical protein
VAAAPLRTSRDLAAAAAGVPVRVAGVVRGAVGGLVLVEDPGGILRLRFAADAAPLAAAARAGDAIAAAGATDREAGDTLVVRVTDLAAVARLGAPGGAASPTLLPDAAGPAGDGAAVVDAPPSAPADPAGDVAAAGDAEAAGDSAASASADDTDAGSMPAEPGALAAALLLAIATAAGAVAARRRIRRTRIDPAVARRLAALGAAPMPGEPRAAPPDARRMAHPAGHPLARPLASRVAARLDARLVPGLSSPPTRAERARPR